MSKTVITILLDGNSVSITGPRDQIENMYNFLDKQLYVEPSSAAIEIQMSASADGKATGKVKFLPRNVVGIQIYYGE